MSFGLCQECSDKLNRERQEKEKERLAEDKRIKNAELRKVFREGKSNIPLYYQFKTFKEINPNVNGNMRKVLGECIRYADNYPLEYSEYLKTNHKAYPSLFITSPMIWGVGKTHLICAILHRIIDRWDGDNSNCPVYFTTEPDIYMRIQNTYSYTDAEREQRKSESDIINDLIRIPLLVIDDVGKQRRSDMKFVQRTLFSIFNGRYDGMKPTILTSNMSLEKLENYLGANDNNGEFDRATFDRLLEMCKGNLWLLDGESQRGK